jgi:CRISPR type I-D-associated protein Csc3/Cas10d
MLRRNYHLVLVKGGPDYPYQPEQSHFTHIINGIFGLIGLIKFCVQNQANSLEIDETSLKKALALFTIHEVHKATDYEPIGSTEFSIPLARLREEYEKLRLNEFVELDEHSMRAANVHKRSTKQGDLMLAKENASLLWLLVRLADTLASVHSPEETCSSLMIYLPKLGPSFLQNHPAGKFTLYYHEMSDVRGVLTNLIHQASAKFFTEKYGFHPLLFFATGTVYLGVKEINLDHSDLLEEVTTRVLSNLTSYEDSIEAIKGGLRKKNSDFEKYVYSFATIERLLEVIREDTILSKPNTKTAEKEIEAIASKRKDLPKNWLETVENRYGISISAAKEEVSFNEIWSLARRYLLYVDTLLRDLNPDQGRLDWFLRTFDIPHEVAKNLQNEQGIWSRGGVGKYVLVISYHFLRSDNFYDRPCEALPREQVIDRLHRLVLDAMRKMDTRAGREAVVAELGFRQDILVYLRENLHTSLTRENILNSDVMNAYISEKHKGHSNKICSLCNRRSDYIDELRTGILDDFGRVFSNRVLPAYEAPGGLRVWCPICHLEFIFRKLTGLGLPTRATYKKSYRIYLYLLPTFSFTPEHLRLFRPIFNSFQKITNLNVRDYGTDFGIPHFWLERREFSPEWTEQLQEALEKAADKISKWGGRNYIGERISVQRSQAQPHYYLIVWEKTAQDSDKEDVRLATRTEAWVKAVLASLILGGFTSCRIFVSERPFLPISDPNQLKTTITLDSPPPALRGILGKRVDTISLYGRERGQKSNLENALDMSAAIWAVTTNLKPGKDKHVSGRLEHVNVNPLAGAYFYKEFARENEGYSPRSPLDIACEVLLENQGGDLMDLVEKIAEKSLQIALPLSGSGRGKPHRYELVFREAVSAIRQAQKAIPGMRQAMTSGKKPYQEIITELKRLSAGKLLKSLERRKASGRGDVMVRAWGEKLGSLVGDFIDLLIDDVYLTRAGGNLATFIRLENNLADGIYYYTDRNLSRLWEEYKRDRDVNKTSDIRIKEEGDENDSRIITEVR